MYGCFVDIRQQDGSQVRMHYPLEQLTVVKWIGINEEHADKFIPNKDATEESQS